MKGIAFGAPMASVQAKFPDASCTADGCVFDPVRVRFARCREYGNDVAKRRECDDQAAEEFNFGPAAPSWYWFEGIDGRVASMTVSFSSSSFGIVTGALEKKYGKPSSRESVPMQNMMGARFVAHVLVWKRPEGLIIAHESGTGNVEKSLVRMDSTAYLKQQAAEDARRVSKGAKKL